MVGPWDVAVTATAVNLCLLLGLGTVWTRNYVRCRSKHSFGLALFGVVLLSENAIGLYYYSLDPTLGPWFSAHLDHNVVHAMMTVDILQTIALVALAWVTMD